jgi:hypothetical protein
MIIEAHGGGDRNSKYTLFDKVGKEELKEGRIHFAVAGGVRVNPYKNPAARVSGPCRTGAETIYILGHGGPTQVNGENAEVWANRLVTMGLQAGDQCTIDLTSCFGGYEGRGFAGSLTAKLFSRNIIATVTASRGHHHETPTGRHIFDTGRNFYPQIWSAAGADEATQQRFLKGTADALLHQMYVEIADPQEQAILFITYLTRVGQRKNKAVKYADIVLEVFQVQDWGGRAILLGSKARIAIAKSEEDASIFIKLVKELKRNSPALAAARLAIQTEALRIWGVHKGIIEGNTPLFVNHTKAPLGANERITFSTTELSQATLFGQQVLNNIINSQWVAFRNCLMIANRDRCTQRAREFRKQITGVTTTTPRLGKFDIIKTHGLSYRIKWQLDCQMTNGSAKSKLLRIQLIPQAGSFMVVDLSVADV